MQLIEGGIVMFASFLSRLMIQVFAFLSLVGSAGALVALGYEADLNPGAEGHNLLVSWESWWFLLSLVVAIGATVAVYRAYDRGVSAGMRGISAK
ncbi:hypothetical protein [Actinomyces ruminicola]|uniref:hypothetical protein n=1 Tax=Actinomyces ruminicola TaxID=332524 RepID=UPI0011C7B5E5|nr:hypothetical protein [Actinomyces ruminicola]